MFDPWVGKIHWRRERLRSQYSDLENSMDCIVHGVAKSQTQLSNFHSLKLTMLCYSEYLLFLFNIIQLRFIHVIECFVNFNSV